MTSFTPVWYEARALLFALDGVLTRPSRRPHTDNDYVVQFNGKPRPDGERDVTALGSATLREGQTDADAADHSSEDIGNGSKATSQKRLRTGDVTPYPGTVSLINEALLLGLKIAVVSCSTNARAVLEAAGLDHYFTVVVDGNVAAQEGLPGKPDPATFEFAAHQLGVESSECVLIEDSVSGVQTGDRGNFHSVIGIDRRAGADALSLLAAGASYVVNDLIELL
jgi:HAD superfamily hydrolase (TIGR01509 family)